MRVSVLVLSGALIISCHFPIPGLPGTGLWLLTLSQAGPAVYCQLSPGGLSYPGTCCAPSHSPKAPALWKPFCNLLLYLHLGSHQGRVAHREEQGHQSQMTWTHKTLTSELKYEAVIWGWINLWENQISELEESRLYLKETGEESVEQLARFPTFMSGGLGSPWGWACSLPAATSPGSSIPGCVTSTFPPSHPIGFGETNFWNLPKMEKESSAV